MAYTTRLKLSVDSIDVIHQRLFVPVVGAVHVHLIEVSVNGIVDDASFWLLHPWVHLDPNKLGYRVSKDDNISIRLEYFYKAERPGLLSFLTRCKPESPDRRTEIISKHYVDGHFALDNGLYKEAVLNFGTVVEGILNQDLSFQILAKMIDTEMNAANSEPHRKLMHDIRKLRNKVHPEQLSETEDVSKYEATQARLALQEIILFYTGKTVAY